MASASQPETYPGICFSKAGLSQKTSFEITKDSVYIFDPTDGYRYTFPGGSDKYSITITDSGTKKRPYKNIAIKKLMPLCPLSGLPVIEPKMDLDSSICADHTVQFKQGFAYNCYQVDLWQHSKFELHSALYYKLGVNRDCACKIYLVVPILDGRHMQPYLKNALMDCLGNRDVINIIAAYYNKLSANDSNFNFHMANTAIKPDTLYHKNGLVDLFNQGKLKLGITFDDLIGLYGYMGSILILEPDAYNHVSFYGKASYLKQCKRFDSCRQMMDFRQKLIETYLIKTN
jgi:hypothetical protein